MVVETVEKKKIEKKEQPLSIFPLQRAETDRYRVVGMPVMKIIEWLSLKMARKKVLSFIKGNTNRVTNGKVIEILADRVIVESMKTIKQKGILKLRKV